jgi:DNA-binding NarL/FixJ family response regulator
LKRRLEGFFALVKAMTQENILHISPQDETAHMAVNESSFRTVDDASFNVLIVGANPLINGLLVNALAHHFKCDARAARRTDLLRMLAMSKTDLLLISADIDSVPGAGFELAMAVLHAYPAIPIILLIDEPVSDQVIRAFISGARGVFSPQDPISQLVDCVEHVRKGSIWASNKVSDCFLKAFRSLPASCLLPTEGSMALSERELQVVEYAARGKTNKTIAQELRLSEHTVKNYLFRAFEKLGVSSRVELLFYLTTRGHSFGYPVTSVGSEEASENSLGVAANL